VILLKIRNRLALILAPTAFLFSSCGSLDPFDQNPAKRIPAVRLLTPAIDFEAVDASFSIQAEFEDVVLEDLWSLYFVSDSSETMKGTIIEGFTVASRTITWETDDIPAGNYSFYAELTSLGGVITSTSPGSIAISHSIVDGNSAPNVSVSSPSSSKLVTIGAATSIIWTGSDADSDTLTASIEYSDDNGSTWSDLVSSVTSPYAWTPDSSFSAGPNYRVRITVVDPSGAAASVRSQKFEIVSGS